MTTMTCSPEAALDVALSDQLAERLCHDLAGLSGNLVGVLELATEDPGSVAEALPLAHEMATTLIARLRLLRAAWGTMDYALDAAGLALPVPGAARRRAHRPGSVRPASRAAAAAPRWPGSR